MQIEREDLPNRQVKLTVTPDDERVQKEMKAAAKRISKRYDIQGFRRGKAPYRIIAQYFGEEAILEEALDTLSQSVYREALEAEEVEPFMMGALVDVATDPLVLTYRIPLRPDVDLGDYRSVRVPYEAPEVTEEMVESELETLQREQATLETVERAVEMGDAAALDIHGTFTDGDEEEFIHQHDIRVLITEEATYPVPGFPDQIVGMTVGDERAFDLPIGDSDEYDEAIRGRTVHFEVTCKEVFDFSVPDLDDELAQSIGDFDTLDELREHIRDTLTEQARRDARSAYLDKVYEELKGVVTIVYPPEMLADELDDMVEEFKGRLEQQGNLTLDDYLKVNDLTEEELRSSFEEAADMRLRRALLLSALVDAEGLAVSEEEVDDEIQTRLLSFGSSASLVSQILNSDAYKNDIRMQLLTDKALDRLAAVARGEAPELPAETDDEPDSAQPDSANSEDE